jgi:hypothetical protein
MNFIAMRSKVRAEGIYSLVIQTSLMTRKKFTTTAFQSRTPRRRLAVPTRERTGHSRLPTGMTLDPIEALSPNRLRQPPTGRRLIAFPDAQPDPHAVISSDRDLTRPRSKKPALERNFRKAKRRSRRTVTELDLISSRQSMVKLMTQAAAAGNERNSFE